MKEQDEYEGARRYRSKTKVEEQETTMGKVEEQDEDVGARRRWKSKTKMMEEQDEDAGAR